MSDEIQQAVEVCMKELGWVWIYVGMTHPGTKEYGYYVFRKTGGKTLTFEQALAMLTLDVLTGIRQKMDYCYVESKTHISFGLKAGDMKGQWIEVDIVDGNIWLATLLAIGQALEARKCRTKE